MLQRMERLDADTGHRPLNRCPRLGAGQHLGQLVLLLTLSDVIASVVTLDAKKALDLPAGWAGARLGYDRDEIDGGRDGLVHRRRRPFGDEVLKAAEAAWRVIGVNGGDAARMATRSQLNPSSRSRIAFARRASLCSAKPSRAHDSSSSRSAALRNPRRIMPPTEILFADIGKHFLAGSQ